ncbi:type-F conjugative transfer system pilin assembly thiol-disulfide isomerase TrbB [Serratia marcescens]|uniref:type-F conjugative transfer system pilin assembly thiol-disulfide isomerase TrbB n=1 Tax=Serratia marcescens TaxID=615 RepID=UPI00147AF183|nr:type-F conjugative transfer system pilin assembly thiol-disulfide isomerase TrbB [Serratia marcescens]
MNRLGGGKNTRCWGALAAVLLVVASGVHAGLRDELQALEQGKPDALSLGDVGRVSPPQGMVRAAAVAKRGRVDYRLRDGRSINIAQWQVVHFIRSDCPYCHQFNPVLRAVSAQLNLPVFVYSFDGKGDATFPDVLPANDTVINDFFAELPKATPTDFLVNRETLVAIPLSQGAISDEVLKQRIDESFAMALRMGVL